MVQLALHSNRIWLLIFYARSFPTDGHPPSSSKHLKYIRALRLLVDLGKYAWWGEHQSLFWFAAVQTSSHRDSVPALSHVSSGTSHPEIAELISRRFVTAIICDCEFLAIT